MAVKVLDLFQAFKEEKLPREGGYIYQLFLMRKVNIQFTK